MTTFVWRDYLTLAEHLERSGRETGVPEAALRSAVSRAYYAVYGLLYGLLWERVSQNVAPLAPTGTPADHRRLQLWLRERGLEQESEALARLRRWRNRRDYEGELGGDLSAFCAASLQLAREILRTT